MSDKASPSHQGNLDGDPSVRGSAVAKAITTALSQLTVLPFKGAGVFDRIAGRRVIAALPVIGLAPAAGTVLITVRLFVMSSSHALALYDVTPILDGALIMVAAQMVTRAMHLDGLANVADALGSYKSLEGVWKVLRDPSTGPVGVDFIVLAMLTTATAFAGIVTSMLAQWPGDQVWSGVAALCLPFAASCAAATTTCWCGFPPFSSSDSGSLAVSIRSTVTVICQQMPLLAVSGQVVGSVGVVARVLSSGITLLLVQYCVERFGGVNGDVLSAVIEIACAACVEVLAIGFQQKKCAHCPRRGSL